MSYESLILSLNPVRYYRLDMVGPGTNGDAIPDSSTNNEDGELQLSGSSPTVPYGHTSPIETDSESRSFFAHNDPLVSRAEITADSAGEIEFTGNMTAMLWVRPGQLAKQFIAKEQDFDGVCWDLELITTGEFRFKLLDSIGTEWAVDAPLVASQNERLNKWAFIVGVRFGDALVIYVDGVQRGSTTITSSLDTLNEGGLFRIGAGISGDYSFYVDEVALFDYALSGSQIRAVYEEALLTLNLRGEANIRTSAILDGSDEPAPVAYPFRHNWEKPVIERLRWKSSVARSVDGPHELARLRSTPRRQIEYQHLLYTEKLRRRFEARGFGGQMALVQFEPDKVQVASLSAGATSATLDIRYRDFQVGQQVLIYQSDDLYEYATLSVVDDDGVQWDEPLARSYTLPFLKPVRVARLPVEQEMEALTDTIGDASTIYDLREEDEPLNPRRIIPFSPTLTYRDREAFDLREWQGNDYNEPPQISYVAERSEVDEGTGLVAAKQYRYGAEQLQPYSMLLEGRPLIAKYLGWLYARAGQSQPFWMPTFRQDLKLEGNDNLDADQIRVEGHEYTQLYASATTRVDLCWIYNDSTYAIRRVEGSAPDDVYDILTLDSSRPTTTNLRFLCFLRRVILSSDDLEIAWHTDNVIRATFAVIDAPLDWEAGSPSMSPSPSASTSTSTSPSPSVSSSRSPSASVSQSPSASLSPSSSVSPSRSPSSSASPSASGSPSASLSPSSSISPSVSPSSSASPSA